MSDGVLAIASPPSSPCLSHAKNVSGKVVWSKVAAARLPLTPTDVVLFYSTPLQISKELMTSVGVFCISIPITGFR